MQTIAKFHQQTIQNQLFSSWFLNKKIKTTPKGNERKEGKKNFADLVRQRDCVLLFESEFNVYGVDSADGCPNSDLVGDNCV